MDLIDKIKEIALRIPKQMEHVKTEEATKNAFVMPFINALGYDVFNPLEVIPEFTADVGTKKGEKVDYAIKKDNSIIMLIECKRSDSDLEKEEMSQLFRYFSVTESRFGILTNGILYKFYSDIDEANKMDSKPFFEFHLLNFDESQLEELKKFTKSNFSLENILTSASILKYTNAIKRIFADEIVNPSEDFIKFFVGQVYAGRMTQSVREQFSVIVKDAINQFIREKINDRLKSALENVKEEKTEQELPPVHEENEEEILLVTHDETDGYNIIKAIVSEIIDPKRISIRNTKNYCGILLDDNNRKPVCRLFFKTSKKHIGLFTHKNQSKELIENVNDIYKYSDIIKATVTEYLEPSKEEPSSV